LDPAPVYFEVEQDIGVFSTVEARMENFLNGFRILLEGQFAGFIDERHFVVITVLGAEEVIC
jgi:hypothetical protein